MLILLHGPDTFRSRRHLKKMIEEFKTKRNPSGLNVAIFDAERIEAREILEAMVASPFLAERRLTVVEKLSAPRQKALWDTLHDLIKNKKLPESTVAIFWEEEIKLTAHPLFGVLAKQKFSQKFEPLSREQLKSWIKEELAPSGLQIESAALIELANYPWDDLWQLVSELGKMSAYFSTRDDETIKASELRPFLPEVADDNIFHLMDALLGRRSKEAIRLLHEQWASGEAEGKIFNMLVGQWRNLLRIKDYLALNPGVDSSRLAQALDLHPFVVKKTLAILPGFDFSRLKEIYQELLEADVKSKSGEGNLKSQLELLIAKICRP